MNREDNRRWWEKVASMIWWASWGAALGAIYMHEQMLANGFHI